MVILVTTRFNNATLVQNHQYMKEQKLGCIYGSPIRINDNIPVKMDLMVLEMNNSKNKITGIGWIKNYICSDKKYNIYNDGNYNRFIYKGIIRIDAEYFREEEIILIEVLEELLFYGYRHSKRSHGICKLPDWIINNSYKFNFKNAVKNMFVKRHLIKKL